MHHKNIKKEVIAQLKKEFPSWKRLPKKMKKELAGKVLKEIVEGYDFFQALTAPAAELLGIEYQISGDGIGIIKLGSVHRQNYQRQDHKIQQL